MDIISSLQRRKLLGEIAVEILLHLNVKDLHAAEKVSLDWREAVVNGKLWEKLFKRNIALYPPWAKMDSVIRKQTPTITLMSGEDDHEELWNEQGLYRKLCLTIADSLEILDKNWATGNYEEEIVHRGLILGPVNSITFLMDDKNIVRHIDSEHTFQFYNRWSLELEQVIPSRPDLGGNQGEHYFVTCFDFSDMKLVIGYGNGVVDVIERKTLKTLHTFRDFNWPFNHSLEDIEANYATEKVIISPKRQFLLSYLYTATSYFLTLRRIKSVSEMTIVHQLQLEENVEELVNLYMDDLYTILFISAIIGHGHCEEVFEIRSTETFLPLHSLEIHDVVCAYHYLNGRLVVGSRQGNSQILSVWDTKNGVSVRKIDLDKEKIVDLRVISDKYVVSVNEAGELKQWDLSAMLNQSVPAEKTLLHRIGNSKALSSCVGGGMVADEYQVVLFGFFRTAHKGQTDNPIIVSLDFMKGQNRVKKPLPILY